MKNIVFAMSIFFTALLLSLKTLGCTCGPLPSVYQSTREADAVFSGKVVSSNEPKAGENSNGDDIIFDVEIIDNFKGPTGKRLKINSGSKNSSCYLGFRVGESYLVYASSKGYFGAFEHPEKTEGVVFQSNMCTRTGKLWANTDEILFIREMLKGKPEPQIYGSIARDDSSPFTPGSKIKISYLEGIKVIVESNKKRFEAVTDKNGLYRFNNIPAGEYTMQPLLGEIFKSYYPDQVTFGILPNKEVIPLGSRMNVPVESKTLYCEFSLSLKSRTDGRMINSPDVAFKR